MNTKYKKIFCLFQIFSGIIGIVVMIGLCPIYLPHAKNFINSLEEMINSQKRLINMSVQILNDSNVVFEDIHQTSVAFEKTGLGHIFIGHILIKPLFDTVLKMLEDFLS